MGPARRPDEANELGIRSQTSRAPGAPLHARRRRRRARGRRPGVGTARPVRDRARRPTAVPAAALRWEDTTLLERLLRQLADLGIREAHVIARPGWAERLEPPAPARGLAVRVARERRTRRPTCAPSRRSPARGEGALVSPTPTSSPSARRSPACSPTRACHRDAHHDGAARVPLRRLPHAHAPRPRGQRGSPYHYVSQPNGTFLGVLKVAPGAPHGGRRRGRRGWRGSSTARCPRAGRASSTQGRALEARALPPRAARAGRPGRAGGRAAVRRGARRRRRERPRGRATSSSTPRAPPSWSAASPPPSRTRPRCCCAGSCAPGCRSAARYLRRLFWARPLSRRATSPSAAERIGEHDEDRALLDSAVKASDGFFTTFFVSPYSKYIARWAARRGWTPNGVTTLSMRSASPPRRRSRPASAGA